jgi:hypothetical protein
MESNPASHPKGQAMSDTKHIPEALYSCHFNCCRQEVSYPAEMLRWYDVVRDWVCDYCWENQPADAKPGISLADHIAATRPPGPALKVAREALEKCKSECSCGAMGCVGHDDTCPVHLKQNALALLAKEGV